MQSSITKAVLVLGLAILSIPASAADFTETKTFSSDTLTLTNLIGEVTISGHRGSGFEVVVHVQGDDASRDSVRLETGRDRLTIAFPDSKKYVYPALENDHEVNFQPNDGDGGWLSSLLGGDRIKVTRDGSGMEVWADIEVRVPSGGNLRLRQGVGEVHANEVDGDLDLDSHYGTVTVDSVDGNLVVDTGSGDVSIAGVNGELSVDTGSGDVEVDGAQTEDIVVDTGSGDVTLTKVASSGDVSIDTGSGDVTLTDVSGSDIDVDTGSGDVNASDIRAEGAMIDTGSGDVMLHLLEMGRGDFDIDTGSGGIQLGLPAGASCRVRAESNGGVSVDLSGVKNMRQDDDDEVAFTIGGGDASVSLDAGSGRIRILEVN